MTPLAIVWMVLERDGTCREVIALYNDHDAAVTFAGRLRAQGREIDVERWEVPGLE